MNKLLILILVLTNIYANVVNLSEADKKYIKTHVFTCITTGTWAPFNTLNNGKLEGISIDFWKTIKHKLHLKSKCIIAPEWEKVLEAIKTQKADITLGTDITEDKVGYAYFTKPYAIFPIVIATKNNIGFIASMHFLKNKKIAIGKNYTVYNIIKKHYPNYKIIPTKNIKEALNLVSEGKVFAAIDIMPVLIYNINKYEFANLKIAGKTPFVFKMRFMVSKKNKRLVNILNKAIDTIQPQQKKQFYSKWISIIYQQGFSLKEILIIVFIFVFLIFILSLWIFFLKKEIKKRKILEKELKKLSISDSLTGIFNRYKIETSLKQQISYSKRHYTPLSIIFFDIDHFKKINDTYGHKTGDFVLKEMSKLVKNNLREYDIFGRWGGEEFIIILPNTTLSKATLVAEKLKNVIEKHKFKYIDHLTCSFGVTEFITEDSLESFINRADTYMYEAKKRGRNLVISDLNI